MPGLLGISLDLNHFFHSAATKKRRSGRVPAGGTGRTKGIPGVTPAESAQGQDDDIPLTATQRAELDRRLATLDQIDARV